MGFAVLLLFGALSLASCAAFFSIYGLAKIFTGIFWPVVTMGISLEMAKLIGASFLYRYWVKIGSLMRFYLISAVIIIMLITSMGIFGFLSAGYQEDVSTLQEKKQKIELLEEQKLEIQGLKDERLSRKKQIDADIASLPNNFVTGRQRLMKSYGPELDKIKIDIENYTNKLQNIVLTIQNLKNQKLKEEIHVGPIVFIADAFSKSTDEATKWLILLIIFAFDPLAVAMTIGVNIILLDKQNKLINDKLVDEKIIRIQKEIVEKEIVDKETHGNNMEAIFKAAFEKLEKKLEPSEEDKQLKSAIGQILRRNQISRNIRTKKT